MNSWEATAVSEESVWKGEAEAKPVVYVDLKPFVLPTLVQI